MPETLTHMGNMSVLVLVNLVNMNMTPPLMTSEESRWRKIP